MREHEVIFTNTGNERLNSGSLRELQREISVVLAHRQKRLGIWQIIFDPVILPYHHFLLGIINAIIYVASSSSFGIFDTTNSSNYVIPSYLTESNFLSVISSPTVVYLDVAFAAIGLPLFCDLLWDIGGYFIAEIKDQDNVSFTTIAEKAKEWCLRLQFIVAFAVNSMVRVFGPTDNRKILLVYLTQFLQVITLCLFGMFSYTDTSDYLGWEYVRSFAISLTLSIALLMVYFASLAEQTLTMFVISSTGKIIGCIASFYMTSLFIYRLYAIFQRMLKPGGLNNLSTKELCFVVHGGLISFNLCIVTLMLIISQCALYRMTLSMYVGHAALLLFVSIALTSLPVRIARYDVRRAKGVIRSTQRKVENTLDSALRYLMTEMDCLLHSANFYQNLSQDELQSLERIVSLCNDVSVSLEEIVDTDLTTTSSFGGDVVGSNVVNDRIEDSLYRNTMRNRRRSTTNQPHGYADREHLRMSFYPPSVDDGCDDHNIYGSSNMASNNADRGYGKSGSAMGESILISSISQDDQGEHDVESRHPLKRRMKLMLDSLKENKRLFAESSLRKDRELEEHPNTDAMFDRLAATMRRGEQPRNVVMNDVQQMETSKMVDDPIVVKIDKKEEVNDYVTEEDNKQENSTGIDSKIAL